MIRRYLLKSLPGAATVLLLSSCTVDENASLLTSGSPTGAAKKEKIAEMKTGSTALTWSERMKADQVRRRAEQATEAASEAARLAEATAKEAAAAERRFADAKKAEEAAQEEAARAEEERLAAAEKARADEEAAKRAAVAEKAKGKAERVAAEKKAREDALAATVREREDAKLAKLEAKKKAEADQAILDSTREVAVLASSRRGGGGFFSRLSLEAGSKQYKSEGHEIYVNQMLLPTLNPSNARIEVKLGEQRARVYRKDGGQNLLVIDTPISSGKPGHPTSTGTFHIKEKLVVKQSTLYGTWVNSSGQTVGSSGDIRSRPSGASRFVGADMPYWMRINGGIGMHIGFVPDFPASHGCIRVPEAIQPLIFSKVGVGTRVTVVH